MNRASRTCSISLKNLTFGVPSKSLDMKEKQEVSKEDRVGLEKSLQIYKD